MADDQSALALFARELHAARTKACMSREALAARVNYSPSLIAMVETCRRVPTLDLARRCDEALGTPGTFERLQEFLRMAPFPSWFRPFVEYEGRAKSLRTFQLAVVPGLLQTEDYARAILACDPGATEGKVDELVAARLDRQAILDRDDPPRLWVVLDEAGLHREAGDGKIMRDQLLRLAEASERPNVIVQIVPGEVGWHAGLLGAFVIADLADVASVAYLETAGGGQVVEDHSVVARIALLFDSLRSEALPRKASRDLIAKVAEERWT